jgi:hypothetical protein
MRNSKKWIGNIGILDSKEFFGFSLQVPEEAIYMPKLRV